MTKWRDLVEGRIQDARARGLFDHLPGGEQREDELASLPAEARMEARIASSTGAAPPEVERIRKLRELRVLLETTTDPEERTALVRAIRDAEIERNVLLERMGHAILIGKID